MNNDFEGWRLSPDNSNVFDKCHRIINDPVKSAIFKEKESQRIAKMNIHFSNGLIPENDWHDSETYDWTDSYDGCPGSDYPWGY